MFPDFPTEGVNSTIGVQTIVPNSDSIVTGGTRAFKGITGEITALELVGDYTAGSFSYANGFEPKCWWQGKYYFHDDYCSTQCQTSQTGNMGCVAPYDTQIHVTMKQAQQCHHLRTGGTYAYTYSGQSNSTTIHLMSQSCVRNGHQSGNLQSDELLLWWKCLIPIACVAQSSASSISSPQ